MKQVYFSEPTISINTLSYLEDILNSKALEGAKYTRLASSALKNTIQCKEVLLTNSCTAALEMIALLLDLQPGDEVIMPSFTFVTTATAFVLRGAIPVFVDIFPKTLNINHKLIEAAITSKTKAIIAVHYAGVGCAMDEIITIAEKHNLFVIEDAAQGINAAYKGRPLGSIGHMAAMSFHPTKNLTAGLGGALLINDERFIDRAKIIWQKGTNREEFFKGRVDKYSWVDVGSSFMPSEFTAAMLYAQLENLEMISHRRMVIWNQYYEAFKGAALQNEVQIPYIPEQCEHNAHIFYLILKSVAKRDQLIKYLEQRNIQAWFHYFPLHLSDAGQRFAKFDKEKLLYTESIYQCLVRLPLHSSMENDEVGHVINEINGFLSKL